jgi:hypothetical protein
MVKSNASAGSMRKENSRAIEQIPCSIWAGNQHQAIEEAW